MTMHENCLCSSSLAGAVCFIGNLQNLRESACYLHSHKAAAKYLHADEETKAQRLAHKLRVKSPGEDANPGGCKSESYQPPKGAGWGSRWKSHSEGHEYICQLHLLKSLHGVLGQIVYLSSLPNPNAFHFWLNRLPWGWRAGGKGEGNGTEGQLGIPDARFTHFYPLGPQYLRFPI